MKQELKMLEIASIRVDNTYQRGLDEKRVRAIAKNFDPGAVKPLSVSRRADGGYYNYDGMHTMEVLALKGYTHAPAYVIDGTREDEARWFVLMNGKGTRKASKAEAYLAGLTAKDPAALGARAVLDRYGLTLATGGVAARAHKVTPRRVLDVAQGMQYATGEPGSGAGHVKRAMLQLARVNA